MAVSDMAPLLARKELCSGGVSLVEVPSRQDESDADHTIADGGAAHGMAHVGPEEAAETRCDGHGKDQDPLDVARVPQEFHGHEGENGDAVDAEGQEVLQSIH